MITSKHNLGVNSPVIDSHRHNEGEREWIVNYVDSDMESL